MSIALGCGACGLVLAGCTAYALSARDGRGLPRLLVRARWAWRCRGNPPVRDEGGVKLSRDELQALGNLAAGRDVRART